MGHPSDPGEEVARPSPSEDAGVPEPAPLTADLDRRHFLAGATLGAVGAGIPAASAQVPVQPEEIWRDRIRDPEDGKRYGWLVDTRRCFGCHGCEVACKAENDVPLGRYIRQTIYHDFPRTEQQMARIAVPLACQQCEDAPCLKSCPCGALHKGAGGTVLVDYDTCSGHGACVEACPYGAIYIDPVANQAIKCHNCTHRLEVGMEPACVSTCPAEALVFGDLADPESRISRLTHQLESAGGDPAPLQSPRLETLRPEKGTRPRMRFVTTEDRPLAEWEPKVPREGESYSPDAYSIFRWGDEEEGA
ncbi:MAG: 4Fe-4S dicluster domain-containing protein [Planctomycetota bacterium]